MPLPTLKTPKYELTIPSTKEKVKFRPFLVKEEKILLMAAESRDPKEIFESLTTVISECIDKKNLDINTWPTFDLEYVFLNLRSKSIGETVEISTQCEECNETVITSVDLSKVSVSYNDKHDSKIQLSKDIGVFMKYPNYELTSTVVTDGTEIETLIKLVSMCIDKIYDKDTIYSRTDYTDDEFEDFVLSLTQSDLDKIKQFFDTMPSMEHTETAKCLKCNHETTLEMRNLNDFFT